MSNLVSVGEWVDLPEVKVGSIIDVFENERKVIDNTDGDLILEGPFGSRQSLSSIYEQNGDDFYGDSHEVYVHREPEEALPWQTPVGSVYSARNDIIARFAKPSDSTASLKSDLEARFGARNVVNKPFNPAAVFGAPKAMVDATADLRARLASMANQAQTASSRPDHANSSFSQLDGINRRIDSLDRDLDGYLRATGSVESRIEDVASQASEIHGRYYGLEHRIDKLELHQKVTTDLNSQPTQNEVATKAQGGNSMLKNILGNFTNLFGKVEKQFALSPIGLAVRSEPKNPFSGYVAYDAKTNTITDVQDLVITSDVPAFKLPVTPDQVKAGDIVLNDGKYQYVVETNDDYVTTVCPSAKARGSVLPVRNMFLNKSFYVVVKTLDVAQQGGFNPALLLAMGDGDKSKLLPFLLMSGGIGQAQAGQIDPMTMMLLSDGADDILPFILMQQGGVTPQGFNPLMLLLMGDKGGSSKDKLLPFLMMGQGGAAGLQGMLPFLLMGEGKTDMKDLIMMQAMGGQNLFGNLFGGQTAPVAPQDTVVKASHKGEK